MPSAPTRCSSTTTTSSTARKTWCRCSRCWRGCEMPWWCYARADALVNLSAESWELVRKSRLRMAYIGAETPNDKLLRSIRKGTRSDQTLEVAELCRRNGVIPELSFMVAPPEDPGRRNRAHLRLHPPGQAGESRTPRSSCTSTRRCPRRSVPDSQRLRLTPLHDTARRRRWCFRAALREWTEPRWVDYSCHADAPWIDERLRAAHPRLRHRAALPVSHRAGHACAALGQDARCAAWRRGAIRCAATTGPGSCRPRRR